MRLSCFTLPSLATTAVATNLYVSSYIGTITSLSLNRVGYGSFSLEITSVTNGSAPSPSWLTLDHATGILYCSDEGLPVPDGSIASYSTSSSGTLTQISRLGTIAGPVSNVVYNDGKALAQAHYSGSSVTTFDLLHGSLQSLENFTFTMDAPGPNPSRQEAPHPHEVVLDPTDSFILVPDLGADLVRVFSISKSSSKLTERTPLKTAPGSGPRHAAFLVAEQSTYLFVVSELANTMTSFEVTYGEGELNFTEVFSSGIYGNSPTPVGAAAAECILAPDQGFVLTSSRNDSLFLINNFDKTNSTKLPSDTLQSWAINPTTGKLSFTQLAPAGGRFPRQFSVNKDGTLAAVGLQSDGRVVIIERNVEDGTFGNFVAFVDIEGGITSVVWQE